ncbi:hypothetical protein BH23GEM6_BH23GEM6_19590 [soil metagenome]
MDDREKTYEHGSSLTRVRGDDTNRPTEHQDRASGDASRHNEIDAGRSETQGAEPNTSSDTTIDRAGA